MFASLVLAASAISLVSAAAVPTAPGGSDVFTAGGNCTIEWTPDTTGKWSQMNIEFMSGPNSPMVHMRTVASNIDGTKLSSFSWTCPQVTPYSKIYFYQFTSAADAQNTAWTTRFTIQNSDGSAPTAPASTDNTANPPVQFGTGAFVDTSLYNAPPSYLAGNGQIDGGKNAAGSSSSGSASGSSSPSGSSAGSAAVSQTGVSSPTSSKSATSSSGIVASATGNAIVSSALNSATARPSNAAVQISSSWFGLVAAAIGTFIAAV